MGAAAAKEADAAALDAAPPPIEDNYALLETPACTEATDALDVQRFLSFLAKIARHREALAAARLPNELPNEAQIAAELFSWSKSFHVSRAPGRLDVMGGIADYSGSRVLQMPIAEACLVALQVQPESRSVRVLSFGATAGGRAPLFELALDELRGPDGQPRPLAELRRRLAREASTAWAAYVVGSLAVLMHEEGVSFEAGMSFIVRSDVPEGKGVSSSAAVEVSAMVALMAAHGLTVGRPERVAELCQMVENLVVGAPCGIMDQMASALGRRGQLLSLLCRPALVQPAVAIPSGVRFWGVDSGVRHSVGGSDYGSVRCAAFMGRAILRWVQRERGETELEHLAEVSPSHFASLDEQLPAAVSGIVFERAFGEHGDGLTQIDPAKHYNVAACTAHPVHEHFRVQTFALALTAPSAAAAAQLPLLGELMYQSHASYSRVGLGSERTDLLVRLVREAGEGSGLFGAKITGGGSGGSVCVVGEAGAKAEASLRRVLARYQQETGVSPYVFEGSSMGALAFGTLHVVLK